MTTPKSELPTAFRRAEVFISATSGDLRTVREVAKQALLTMDCHPVEMTNFGPDWRTVRKMLSERITDCDAVLHVVGQRYGQEPDPAPVRRLPSHLPQPIHSKLHSF